MSIDVHIYGVHARDNMISELADALKLTGKFIHYDDRPNGGSPLYTCKKAWLSPVDAGITHRIVLQDDVAVCDDFLEIAAAIAETHPKAIVSFFPFQFQTTIPGIAECGTPYFLARPISGCGVMMPVEYIEPCFDYIRERYDDAVDDDQGMSFWANSNGVLALTTIPALVQHLGDVSVANPKAPVRRTPYFAQNPHANWKSTKIISWTEQEWFFSNHGKPRKDKGVIRVVEY